MVILQQGVKRGQVGLLLILIQPTLMEQSLPIITPILPLRITKEVRPLPLGVCLIHQMYKNQNKMSTILANSQQR